MCFYISFKHPEKKIANRDIVCYKRLCTNFKSPYQYKLYTLNKLYESPITISKDGFTITEGLHSYSCKIFAINNRLLSFEILVKGIIPKGSEYYYNPDEYEYVSNQIILQEIIK